MKHDKRGRDERILGYRDPPVNLPCGKLPSEPRTKCTEKPRNKDSYQWEVAAC